jgi:hypothetical protein
MDRNSLFELAAKLRELRQLSPLYWRLGREGNIVFICDPTSSLSWWTFFGTVDELLALSVLQLYERRRYFYRTRSTIWFPPSQWSNGIGEAEIEEYHGRDTYAR